MNNGSRPIVFVGHDASRTGAPIVLLELLRWLKKHTDLPLRVVLLNGGNLAAEFAAVAPTVTLTEISIGRSGLLRKIGRIPLLGPKLKQLWHRFVTPRIVEQRPSLVYANSVATAPSAEQTSTPGVPVVVHVHELENTIQLVAGDQGMSAIKSLARRYIAVSRSVQENLVTRHGVDGSMIDIIPVSIPIDESIMQNLEALRRTMRRTLHIPDNAKVIGGCGTIGWRKGVDLFVEMARSVAAQRSDNPTHFVWVGKIGEDDFTRKVLTRIREGGLDQVCHFIGEHQRPIEVFCGFDVFVLPSREDPMPLVALEAACAAKPIVCFADAGGMPELVGHECGRVVSPMTAEALAAAVLQLISSCDLTHRLGDQALEKVRKSHDVVLTAPRILKIIKEEADLDNEYA